MSAAPHMALDVVIWASGILAGTAIASGARASLWGVPFVCFLIVTAIISARGVLA